MDVRWKQGETDLWRSHCMYHTMLNLSLFPHLPQKPDSWTYLTKKQGHDIAQRLISLYHCKNWFAQGEYILYSECINLNICTWDCREMSGGWATRSFVLFKKEKEKKKEEGAPNKPLWIFCCYGKRPNLRFPFCSDLHWKILSKS